MTLSCKLNRNEGAVLWRHDGKEIKPGGRFTVHADGAQRSLTVSSVVKEDEGEYTCECKEDKTTATITTKGELTGAQSEFALVHQKKRLL